jgi:hypothetical protein
MRRSEVMVAAPPLPSVTCFDRRCPAAAQIARQRTTPTSFYEGSTTTNDGRILPVEIVREFTTTRENSTTVPVAPALSKGFGLARFFVAGWREPREGRNAVLSRRAEEKK